METSSNTSPDFFENLYRQCEDPWDFKGSPYERERFAIMAKALAGRRYAHALEPGCSIGMFTAHLAGLCDRVTAFDFSETAVEHARTHCHDLPHVAVSVAALGQDTAVKDIDLLVLSEIGYYFPPATWRELIAILTERMSPGTIVLASHWLGESDEHIQRGDAVHETIRAEPRLELELERRYPGFRLDRFRRI